MNDLIRRIDDYLAETARLLPRLIRPGTVELAWPTSPFARTQGKTRNFC